MPLTFRPDNLPGVMIIEPKVFSDERGYLMETYKRSEFVAAGVSDFPTMDQFHTIG